MNRPHKDDPYHIGHRQRLRARFLEGGGGALADYELLELLLCLAQPRRDMKPTAKRLIKEFGSFAAVMHANPDELRRIAGMGEVSIAAVKCVQAAAILMARQELTKRPVIGSWRKLLDYCHATMAHQKVEQARLLFLDSQNALIADEVQQTGTVNHAPLYPREVAKRALELSASAVIMLHNHPSGDPTPSADDIAMTREIQSVLEKLGIELHDHVIIGRHGHASFRNLRLL